jgi:2-polyprenyl-6-methoxyphenol hydroxylase-like FAD-dependent oxidoreductase
MLILRQVRELANISFNNPFNGEPYHIPHQEAIEKNAQYMTLADILLEGSHPSTFLRDSLTATIHPSGSFLLVPLSLPDDIEPSNPKNLTFWRVAFTVVIKHDLPPAQPDLAYIQESFDKRRGIWEEKEWAKVAEVRTGSRYRVREAMASTMHKPFGDGGNILLAGDAAHVHSPAGGQGTFKYGLVFAEP